MSEKKCPSCSGVMELSKSGRKWICPYCNEEIANDIKESEIELKDGLPLNIFYLEKDMAEDNFKKDTKELLKSLKYCLNELKTLERIETYMKKLMADTDSYGSDDMEGVHKELANVARERLGDELKQDERIILYTENGMFARRKEFNVITDKRCFFVNKKDYIQIKHTDIVDIKVDTTFGMPSWYLNGDYKKSITSNCTDNRMLGAIIAIVCLLSFKNDTERERIRLV
ncbi:MAG: hypothetical protein IJ232_09410 [Lachnospiraceae bacterium]|nr:hypothetical protein [Lachnospiraceae bacterium]